MKRCTVAHDCPGFGRIPVGSLWADDSEYLTEANADCFDDVEPEPAPKSKKPAKSVAAAFVKLVEYGPEGND